MLYLIKIFSYNMVTKLRNLVKNRGVLCLSVIYAIKKYVLIILIWIVMYINMTSIIFVVMPVTINI